MQNTKKYKLQIKTNKMKKFKWLSRSPWNFLHNSLHNLEVVSSSGFLVAFIKGECMNAPSKYMS